MRLVTWNVAGLHEDQLDERTEAQCLAVLLEAEPYDVIALQELVRRSWHAHWKHHLSAAGFQVIPADPTKVDSEYFCAVAIREALRPSGGLEAFPLGTMGRNLVSARVGPWLVCTAHLESQRAGAVARVAQAGHAIGRLLGHEGPAVFAGDTNLRAEEEPAVARLGDVRDGWEVAGRAAGDRATWRGNGGKGWRFDRIWAARARITRFAARDYPGALSDHRALEATLEAE